MVPKYFRLKEKINEEILKGTYPLLSKLPTEIELSEMYNCSRATVRSALSLLEEEGIIAKKWGSGNVIMKNDLGAKKNVIAIVLPDKSTQASYSFLEDFKASIYKERLELEIIETKGKISLEAEALNSLLKESYAGAVIEPVAANLPSINTENYQKLIRRGLPLVFLNSLPFGINGQPLVKLNYYDLGYKNARLLINRGATKIGGIFLRDSAISVEAYGGFIAAINDAGLLLSEDYFLWCNSFDQASHLSRGSAAINKFMKVAASDGAYIYCDDSSLHSLLEHSGKHTKEGLLSDNKEILFFNHLGASRSLGKSAASNLLSIKKGGTPKDVTVSID